MSAITPQTPLSILDRIQQINEAVQDSNVPIEQRVALLSSALTEIAYGVALQGKCLAMKVNELKNTDHSLEQSITNLTTQVADLTAQLDTLTAEKEKADLIQSWQGNGRTLNAVVLTSALGVALVNPLSAPLNFVLVGVCYAYEVTTISFRVSKLEKEMNAYLEQHPNGKKTEALLYAKRAVGARD